MKLITEFNDSVKSRCILNEATKEKQYFIEGIYAQSEVKNRNGRIYPREVLFKGVDDFVNDYVKHNRAFGELNHPESPSINLERACILIKELKKSGNDVLGKAVVLNTPMGNIVKGILSSGGQVGVSTRALGSVVESDEAEIVQDDFILNTIDVVSDPSAPNAFVNGIMESCEWFKQGDKFIKQTKKAQNKINEAIRLTKIKEERERLFVEAFTNFINDIKL